LSSPKDYRPISLTSFILKILEKLLDVHIRNDVGRLTPSNQHAFTKGKSLEAALHSLVITIERALHIKENALGVFVYISEAYNNIKTDAIMIRLEATNTHPAISLWIRCEELNNSPQISAAAATDGRPLTRYVAITRSNGTDGRESLENSVQES